MSIQSIFEATLRARRYGAPKSCDHDWFVHVGEFVRTCSRCGRKEYSIENRGYRVRWTGDV